MEINEDMIIVSRASSLRIHEGHVGRMSCGDEEEEEEEERM